MMIAGAADEVAPLAPTTSQTPTTPLGEGAVACTLEKRETALERGIPILGEILGYGQKSEALAFNQTSSSSQGLIDAIKIAVSRSGIKKEDIALVCGAHQRDKEEQKYIQKLLGKSVPFISTSQSTGFIEASSSLQALTLILYALHHDKPLPKITTNNPIKHILLIGSSDAGSHYALIIQI